MNIDPLLRSKRTAAFGVMLGLGALATGCGGETKTVTEPSPNSQANLPGQVCEWSKAHPQPLASEHPVKMRVDSRCNNDASENKNNFSAPAGVFSKPRFEHQYRIGAVPNGEVVAADCYAPQGDVIQDSRGGSTASPVWVKIHRLGQKLTGFIPDVNMGFSPVDKLPTCK
jgi:hypothetical protein